MASTMVTTPRRRRPRPQPGDGPLPGAGARDQRRHPGALPDGPRRAGCGRLRRGRWRRGGGPPPEPPIPGPVRRPLPGRRRDSVRHTRVHPRRWAVGARSASRRGAGGPRPSARRPPRARSSARVDDRLGQRMSGLRLLLAAQRLAAVARHTRYLVSLKVPRIPSATSRSSDRLTNELVRRGARRSIRRSARCWRGRADSNRCAKCCRLLPSHSATPPGPRFPSG